MWTQTQVRECISNLINTATGIKATELANEVALATKGALVISEFHQAIEDLKLQNEIVEVYYTISPARDYTKLFGGEDVALMHHKMYFPRGTNFYPSRRN